jgi:vanillate/4-hydroxybenzoate decarboxylase subunit D
MFTRPTTPEVHAARTPVDGRCPACGAVGLQAYRVLSERGWWDVVKCPSCLHSARREPGPLFGTLTAAIQSLIPSAARREG